VGRTKEKAKELKYYILALYLAYKRKDVPIIAKVIIIVTIGYALSPVDLIPDFIPVLGYLDDLIITISKPPALPGDSQSLTIPGL
jgi:uncharacterized membrane protein YkvA (DUF1232 family)